MNKRLFFYVIVVLQIAVLSSSILYARQRSPHRIPAGIGMQMEDEITPQIRERIEERTGKVIHSAQAAAMQDEVFNVSAKRADVIKLVDDAMQYLQKESDRERMFNMFTHGKEFKRGELYVFVFDVNGTCYAHGEQAAHVWKNMYEVKDSFGTPVVKTIIKKGKDGGGWVTYEWRGSTKVSYVRQITKGGKTYIIGSGYYPHSKDDAVIMLVRGAVTHFDDMMKEGRPVGEAFSTITYPIGRFIRGDLYLYALDFKGNTVAHGERPGLIGSNSWNYRDTSGKFVNQDIVRMLQEKAGGVWIEYVSKNATKRAYAEQVTDSKGNSYFIACGYYPDADRRQVEELVRKGYKYMKTNGESKASKLFSDKREMDFRYGDLYLFVYDMKGKCVAHGGNPDLVSRNRLDIKNEDGVYYVKEILAKAQGGGGWVNYRDKNLFQSVYVEPIDLGVKKYVIGSGLFPVSKTETMALLVKSAASYLQTKPEEEAFREFTNVKGPLIRGDLVTFAFDFDGICYAFGDNHSFIWKNFFDAKDDNGQSYIKTFINTVKLGPGKVSFMINGVPAVALVQEVRRNGRSYVVGSRYFK